MTLIPTCCGRGKGIETLHLRKQHQAPGPTEPEWDPCKGISDGRQTKP